LSQFVPESSLNVKTIKADIPTVLAYKAADWYLMRAQSIMDKNQKPLDEKFRLKKPVKIQYASPEEVSVATSQVLKEHWLAFDLLAKS
jgi:hypothetical protein